MTASVTLATSPRVLCNCCLTHIGEMWQQLMMLKEEEDWSLEDLSPAKANVSGQDTGSPINPTSGAHRYVHFVTLTLSLPKRKQIESCYCYLFPATSLLRLIVIHLMAANHRGSRTNSRDSVICIIMSPSTLPPPLPEHQTSSQTHEWRF